MATRSICARSMIALFAIFISACSIISPSPRAPTPVPTLVSTGNGEALPTLLPTADFTGAPPTAIPSTLPSPVIVPTVTPVAPTAPPTLPPSGFSLLVNPDLLWSIRYPANQFSVETQSDGTVLLRTSDKTVFAAVASYAATGNEFGSSGEGLRSRARDALERILGKPLKSSSVIQGRTSLLETGISYSTDDGFTGEAFYGQTGRAQKNFRVYGFLFGYKSGTDPRLVTTLKSMRDSLIAVTVSPLDVGSSGKALWLVFSQGMRGYNAQLEEGHFVAVYSKDGAWKEVSHIDLQNADYVAPDGVRQVQVEPTHLWFTAESGVGAHGDCFELISFDGQALRSQVAHCQSGPVAGFLSDLNGDGIPEVVLDTSDYYVFCYACGVRYVDNQVLRWNNGQWIEVNLTKLSDSASADLRNLTNRAVDLAQGEFWKEAKDTIDQAMALNAQDPTVMWDAALIHLIAEGRAEQAQSSAYPLLDNLFYGDYPTVLNILKSYPPAQLFTPKPALVVGTAAQGFENSLTDWITRTTTLSLKVKPDLASAYFIRGWGVYQGSPGTAKAQADVSKAAQLDPKEPIYASSLTFLKSAVLPPLANRDRIQFASGATSATVNTSLAVNTPKGYVVRALAKQNMMITATNNATVIVLDAQDNRQSPGSEQPGRWQGALSQTGDYTVVLFGQGAVSMTVKITQ